VESLTCRLLPFATANGPDNMAADEALLESAVGGTPSLRFYAWTEPTVTLGYFQSASSRDRDSAIAGLPFVRRLTGGNAIVHHHELTYALALPAPWAGQRTADWLSRMHGIIAEGLGQFGVEVSCHPANQSLPFSGTLCFQHFTPGDVMLAGSKIVGSAQRRRKGALLQHGSILLRRSPFAPGLPGIAELSGQLLNDVALQEKLSGEFARETSLAITPADWSEQERRRVQEFSALKYSQESWNRKR
jgi:lipoate-protein ligase A